MNLITEDLILFNCDAQNRDEAINKMADAMENAGRISDKSQYLADVFKRESDASTAVGFSIATPHAKSAGVIEPSLGFMRFSNPIQWDDGSEPVSMAFQIAVPTGGGEQHLEILATIFRNLIHEDFREKLSNAKNPAEICDIVGSL